MNEEKLTKQQIQKELEAAQEFLKKYSKLKKQMGELSFELQHQQNEAEKAIERLAKALKKAVDE